MTVNFKLLHYARQMADVKPAQYSEAVENLSKRVSDSKMIEGLVKDVFDSKTFKNEALKLKDEFKGIEVPKNAFESFFNSIKDLVTENIPSMSISEAQAKRMKLKKAIKQNEPVRNFLKDVNEQLGKSEAARNIALSIDNMVKTVQESMFKQPMPKFMRMGQELLQEAVSKGSLAAIRDTINYLTK